MGSSLFADRAASATMQTNQLSQKPHWRHDIARRPSDHEPHNPQRLGLHENGRGPVEAPDRRGSSSECGLKTKSDAE
jgi:hypothetical protein